MARTIPSLGDLEIQVLRLIWREQPCSERTVSELVMAEKPVARTTVLKTMQRLEEKGLLTRVADSSPILFRASVDRERVEPTLIRRFVEGALGGALGPLAAFLADSNAHRLSKADLQSLREIALKMEKPTTSPEDNQ